MTWIDCTLKEIISFGNGKARPKTEGKTPIYGGNGILGYAGSSNYEDETTIIGRVGAYCGSTYFENQPIWVSDNALAAKAKPGFDSKYIYYVLKHKKLNQYAQGSSHPLLTQSLLNSLDVAVNDDPIIQHKIARITTALEDRISINEQINQTLEAMAKAIFKGWFVDFEPIRAKVAALEAGGTEEDANLAAMSAISGKSAEDLAALKTSNAEAYAGLYVTATLFPSRLVESELGDIPDGWNLSEIGNEIEAAGGATPSTKETEFWENGTVHWTTPKDMSDLKDKVLIDTERKITEAGLRKISSGLLPIDTILMSSRAPVGYLAIAKIPVAINQGYIAMKCNKQLTPEFVIQWCVHNMEEIKQRASGTTFAEISKKSFYPIPVVVPAAQILRSYTNSVRNFYSQIETLARENQNLAIIRDSLLPKLLSGEISVENQLGSEG